MVDSTAEYQSAVYDRYNQLMTADLNWTNKTATGTEVGIILVTTSLGDLSQELTVNIVDRIKSREENITGACTSDDK
ncbi:hypothetical protein [Ruminiclostridium cellobioparum]|uniref:hypothetical protein n=1 Tax=Ruminiclostridium cellobioparum TaxID=29355 RepID=UPI0028B0B660|nr:hypothetical protein [Ruminiclostridium cellobioparum]